MLLGLSAEDLYFYLPWREGCTLYSAPTCPLPDVVNDPECERVADFSSSRLCDVRGDSSSGKRAASSRKMAGKSNLVRLSDPLVSFSEICRGCRS